MFFKLSFQTTILSVVLLQVGIHIQSIANKVSDIRTYVALGKVSRKAMSKRLMFFLMQGLNACYEPTKYCKPFFMYACFN